MGDQTDNPVDLKTRQMFLAYGDGVPVVEIAEKFGYANPSSVYAAFNEHPSEYEAAKESFVAKRIAKYRRAGSLAINLQLKYLEYMTELAANEENKERNETLAKEVSKVQAIGEAAERRADLNEGKPTDRTETHAAPLSAEELNRLMLDIKHAGTGLDQSSIAT